MNTLHHSFSAFRRYMQMSRNEVFVFNEGKTDPYFYGEICQRVCDTLHVDYQLCAANELCTIPNGSGGKQILLGFYNYLLSKSSLIDDFEGKRTVSLFYMDKDIDDLLNRQLDSPHFIVVPIVNTAKCLI